MNAKQGDSGGKTRHFWGKKRETFKNNIPNKDKTFHFWGKTAKLLGKKKLLGHGILLCEAIRYNSELTCDGFSAFLKSTETNTT